MYDLCVFYVGVPKSKSHCQSVTLKAMVNLEQKIEQAVKGLFDVEVKAELSRPEEQFGDYSTSVALQLAGKIGQKPHEIAETLAKKLRDDLNEQIIDVTVAGPGFINLKLSDKALINALYEGPAQVFEGQEVLVEFGDPNPFKEMHIGHLYSYVAGDAISSLFEAAGANVRRLSYHGDVGLHVAKAIWGMQKEGFNLEDPKQDIGYYYAKGAAAYEDDEVAKKEIDEINRQVYEQAPSINQLYEQGRARSFANFDQTLSTLGIRTDKRYLESETAPEGTELVEHNTGKVFTKSEGAIVYEGEKTGLHTRVFITGKGLPTYETKDLGLTQLKKRDYPKAIQSVIITAHEQAEYFKVMLAALSEIDSDLASKTKHMSHGFVSLSTGKMSSRTGEVYGADNLLEDVKKAAEKLYKEATQEVQIGAVKYEFVRHRLGGDIVYDINESVSLEGNSGPYLQYAHARARSILRKAEGEGKLGDNFEKDERSLARKISEYPEVVNKAVQDLMPHHIATYLYELAQTFNRFYEHNRVVGDKRQEVRLALVAEYADKLKSGLQLLGIAAPDKM